MRRDELRIDTAATLTQDQARIASLEREVDALHRQLDNQRDNRQRERRQDRDAAYGDSGE
jgi:hypothetical protein